MPHARPDPQASLPELIRMAARQLRSRTLAAYEPVGLTPHQARALRLIGSDPGVRPSVLAERLRVAPRSATDVVDALAARGLVTRRADPADRRALRLSPTPEGSELIEQADQVRDREHEAWLAGLSEHDRDQLRRLLQRLVEAA